MYFVFTPNKAFVQFQLSDYFSDSTDLVIIRTKKRNFSIKKDLYRKKRKKRNGKLAGKKEQKRNQPKLADFFDKESAGEIKNVLSLNDQNSKPFSIEKGCFNLISSDVNEDSLIKTRGESCLAIQEKSEHGNYYLNGQFGKYLPLTLLLEEKKEITSRYAAGLIHELYLEDFDLFKKLETFGVKKKGGFTVKELFLTLYYLFFITCKSFERFSVVNSEEFSILINNLSKPKPDTLRKFLKQAITPEVAFKFSNHVYSCLNQLDANMGRAVYVDEHLIPYQGTKKMAKGKAGGKNGLKKGFYRFYLTCAMFSMPIFSLARDGSARLEPVLFDVLEAHQRVVGKKIELLIFDRGIKSFQTLKKLEEAGYYFICWSFPYSTVENALKRRHRLKMTKISGDLRELISRREKSRVLLKGKGKPAQIREIFETCLPIHALKDKLRGMVQKEKRIKKWNKRDFIRIGETQIEFEKYGLMRTIILEKISGERIGVFTNLPPELACSIEVLFMLKQKQDIENFFAYKKAIRGDYVPFWELEESSVQKTRFHHEIQRPSASKLGKFEKKVKRIKNFFQNSVQDARTWENLFESGTIKKKTFKKIKADQDRRVEINEGKLKEIRAFITWAKKKKRPKYFAERELMMEPNLRIERFLNALNDLFFVNSRRIAADWANALKIANDIGEITLREKKIEEIRNFMPERLNDILLKGGGTVSKSPNNGSEIFVELHVEFLQGSQNLIEPYLKMVNNLNPSYRFCHDSNYSITFLASLLHLPKLAKIV